MGARDQAGNRHGGHLMARPMLSDSLFAMIGLAVAIVLAWVAVLVGLALLWPLRALGWMRWP